MLTITHDVARLWDNLSPFVSLSCRVEQSYLGPRPEGDEMDVEGTNHDDGDVDGDFFSAAGNSDDEEFAHEQMMLDPPDLADPYDSPGVCDESGWQEYGDGGGSPGVGDVHWQENVDGVGQAQPKKVPYELDVPFDPSGQPNGDPSELPELAGLHHQFCQDAEHIEGGPGSLCYNKKAAGSDYYPYPNRSVLLLANFVEKYKLSRVVLEGLLAMLRFRDVGGEKFEISELDSVHHEHFRARMRKYTPLFSLFKRTVKASATAQAAGQTTADVYDIPINEIIARKLQSETAMVEMLANQGGKVLSDTEAENSRLGSPHILSVPVVKEGGKMHNNMHGKCARRSPFFGVDGVIGELSPSGNTQRKIYTNDVAMVTVPGHDNTMPCRILGLRWDEGRGGMTASLRRFRFVEEVTRTYSERYQGLLRVWEELGGEELLLPTSSIRDLCCIYSRADVNAGGHIGPWAEGELPSGGQRFVGEGFVKERKFLRDPKRIRSGGNYALSHVPWEREFTPDGPLFSIRKAGYFHNRDSLPAVMWGLVEYIDKFNCVSLNTKNSVGGTYMGLASNSLALQRKRGQVDAVTVASKGASCEGEMEFQCRITGALQKGCIAVAHMPARDGQPAYRVKVRKLMFCVCEGCCVE